MRIMWPTRADLEKRLGRLPTIEESLGPANVECPVCEGEGWRCEYHPDVVWPHNDCAGPGMPCLCRPGAKVSQS